MAAIDRTNYKRIQRSYYNINIYNDTNDVIECKYSANMIVPLLDKPNQYEVSVVRASVPLDGIPISQVNIGFQSWQVQFTNTQTTQTSNAYVSQFNPTPAYIEYINTAIIGFMTTNLQVITIPVGTPSGELAQAIATEFGSFDEFQKKIAEVATNQFGSGWAWLIVTKEGKLAITSTSNQDNPLMPNAEVKGTPILAIDVWEHAYYLNYQNKRADYLTAIFNVIDWKIVGEKYTTIISQL